MNSNSHAPVTETPRHAYSVGGLVSVPANQSPLPRTIYRTRLATAEGDILAAQRLRFEVFNVELQEGLRESWESQLDEDRFNATCDHLVIEHIATAKIVGTYRLQTGEMAANASGYYSEQEFDFAPFESFRSEIVELGRACVHQEHRRGTVLDMLWRGIATYARERNSRYLLGCSSLTSQDAALGHATYAQLAPEFLAPGPFRTSPLPGYALPDAEPLAECPRPPRLLRTYLAVGAKICGEPAIDREFGTIDFLTLIDLTTLPAATMSRFIS